MVELDIVVGLDAIHSNSINTMSFHHACYYQKLRDMQSNRSWGSKICFLRPCHFCL